MPFDTLSYLLGKNSGSGGGGNPNSVQVVSGTMESPLPNDIDQQAFYDGIKNGNVHATILYDLSSLGLNDAPTLALVQFYPNTMYDDYIGAFFLQTASGEFIVYNGFMAI